MLACRGWQAATRSAAQHAPHSICSVICVSPRLPTATYPAQQVRDRRALQRSSEASRAAAVLVADVAQAAAAASPSQSPSLGAQFLQVLQSVWNVLAGLCGRLYSCLELLDPGPRLLLLSCVFAASAYVILRAAAASAGRFARSRDSSTGAAESADAAPGAKPAAAAAAAAGAPAVAPMTEWPQPYICSAEALAAAAGKAVKAEECAEGGQPAPVQAAGDSIAAAAEHPSSEAAGVAEETATDADSVGAGQEATTAPVMSAAPEPLDSGAAAAAAPPRPEVDLPAAGAATRPGARRWVPAAMTNGMRDAAAAGGGSAAANGRRTGSSTAASDAAMGGADVATGDSEGAAPAGGAASQRRAAGPRRPTSPAMRAVGVFVAAAAVPFLPLLLSLKRQRDQSRPGGLRTAAPPSPTPRDRPRWDPLAQLRDLTPPTWRSSQTHLWDPVASLHDDLSSRAAHRPPADESAGVGAAEGEPEEAPVATGAPGPPPDAVSPVSEGQAEAARPGGLRQPFAEDLRAHVEEGGAGASGRSSAR